MTVPPLRPLLQLTAASVPIPRSPPFRELDPPFSPRILNLQPIATHRWGHGWNLSSNRLSTGRGHPRNVGSNPCPTNHLLWETPRRPFPGEAGRRKWISICLQVTTCPLRRDVTGCSGKCSRYWGEGELPSRPRTLCRRPPSPYSHPHGSRRPRAPPPRAGPHLQTLVQHKSHHSRGVQRPPRQRPGPGPLALLLDRRPPGFRAPRAQPGRVP